MTRRSARSPIHAFTCIAFGLISPLCFLWMVGPWSSSDSAYTWLRAWPGMVLLSIVGTTWSCVATVTSAEPRPVWAVAVLVNVVSLLLTFSWIPSV